MSMNIPLPSDLAGTGPGQAQETRDFVFDHVPSLRELLPQYRGLPGYEYLQCCVQHLRRAQDEGWTLVERTVIYIIKGPLGEQSMSLLARGKRIPGQPHDSGARLCICDLAVQTATGCWINPHQHLEPEPKPNVQVGSKTVPEIEAQDPTPTPASDTPLSPIFTGGQRNASEPQS